MTISMQDVRIIETNVKHIDDIMIVEKLCFEIPWSRAEFIHEISENELAVYLSAEFNERVIGYIGMWNIHKEGHITNIAVHPQFRMNGIGELLVKNLMDISKKTGIESMTLEVKKSNMAAQRLYIRHGFTACGLRKSYYADNGEDAIIMWNKNI